MAYKALIKRSALKDLQAVPKSDQKRLLDFIENNLSKDPYQGKALSGEFKRLYRWRSGKFRIIYRSNKNSWSYWCSASAIARMCIGSPEGTGSIYLEDVNAVRTKIFICQSFPERQI